ncbi:ATP-binding protein [Methylomarinum sp. Ch1-1]|uniref:histidine kinase n=1 Tax=Methylomarinum roseum TaxID=3067653 RepID=A0AAU7NZF2_9GAMM|nr:ATP-binding protein [Methylomarinum sp. Ch1-1]MDP4521535.1 ATP-binding protein [Methylomarinum sp. Ch1-1]
MRNLLFRPLIVVSMVLSLFILAELVAIGGLTWRNHQRLNILEKDIRNGHRLEETIFILLKNQLQQSKADSQPDRVAVKLENILPPEQINDPGIIADIRKLQAAFGKAVTGDNDSLVRTLDTTRQIFSRQIYEEENLLEKIAEDSQLEFELAVVLPLLTFLILFVIGRYVFKRNVLTPLDSLKEFLQMLARGDRRPIQQQTADPNMQALFDNYNKLVMRLTELEREQQDYTTELEHKIRQTTSSLLEKSQQIARSERLSVVAELAASTAHELRNPLAGIQLALENILLDCDDPELCERLTTVNTEIKRLTQHLNDLLALTRPSTDSAEPVDIERICNELSLFLKYQIPENVSLRYNIDPKLNIHLPATEFRLALLNLLLNSIHAIGQEPGHIELTVRQAEKQMIITVEDSGPGFAESLLKKGIQPFVSLKKKGTGLGLAMVQRFVKSRQGEIRLHNNDQGHACVTLTLPLTET